MPHGYSALVSELNDALTRQRYNRVAVHNYCRNADCFLAYLTEREIALEAVTPADVTAYLRFAVRQFRKRHGRAPARYWIGIPRSRIHALLKLALKRWPPETAAINAGERLCREVCDQYQTWLREERGLAAASVDVLLWEARDFCAWLIKHSNASFAGLTVRDLDIYTDMRARGLTRKLGRHLLTLSSSQFDPNRTGWGWAEHRCSVHLLQILTCSAIWSAAPKSTSCP